MTEAQATRSANLVVTPGALFELLPGQRWRVDVKRDFGRAGYPVHGRWVRTGFVLCDERGRNLLPEGRWFSCLDEVLAFLQTLQATLRPFGAVLPSGFDWPALFAQLRQPPQPAPDDPNALALSRAITLLGQLGWRQAKLARRLGVDVNTVSRWLTGKVAVPRWVIEYLEALAAVRELAIKLEVVGVPEEA